MSNSTRSLERWLQRLEQLHPTEIDLGLDRIGVVAHHAGLIHGLPPIITVGGTNGKGSVVEYLQCCLEAAGVKTGAYTSPHLYRFNERIRVAGVEVDDATLIDAFEAIEQARVTVAQAAVSLTYFEFSTLAAMHIFRASELDVIILEVGLGGRLDAANLWDASCALITSIGIDHEEWLGSDRETIAAEKVAIARRGYPLIVGERQRPYTLDDYAARNDIPCYRLGQEFDVQPFGERFADEACKDTGDGLAEGFRWQRLSTLDDASLPLSVELPLPGLAGPHQLDNAAIAICALKLLPSFTAVPEISNEAIAIGLQQAELTGRMQQLQIHGQQVLLDVAHNPAAADVLASTLQQYYPGASCVAVFAIMKDKDYAAVVERVAPFVKQWHCADLRMPRGLLPADAASMIKLHYPRVEVLEFADVNAALQAACDSVAAASVAESNSDRPTYVLVFGSFFTVSAVLEVSGHLSN